MKERAHTENRRKLVKASDALVILALLLLALGLHFFYQARFNKSELIADIYYQNQLIESIELVKGKPQQWHYPQNTEVIFAIRDDASIAFKSSNCPDQVCVNSGYLHSEHAFAACLPNEFLLVLRSPETASSVPQEPEVDIVN